MLWEVIIVLALPRQYFARSIDNGSTFQTIPQLIDSIPGAIYPVQLSSVANNVYVVWSDDTDLSYLGIYMKESTDGGATFSPPFFLSNGINPFILPGLPRIATDGDNVYVAWRGISSYTDQIFFTRSTDGGATFSRPINLQSLPSGQLGHPSVGGQLNHAYIVWPANSTGNYKIFFTKSWSTILHFLNLRIFPC